MKFVVLAVAQSVPPRELMELLLLLLLLRAGGMRRRGGRGGWESNFSVQF